MANKSGRCGKIVLGASDFADVSNWSLTISSNNPEFSHSGSSGHKVSVGGVKSASVSFNAVLNTDDPLYDRIKPGDGVTLLLHEDATRKWTVPVRITSIADEVDISDGGEITLAVEAAANGAWTYPDGTVSSNGC